MILLRLISTGLFAVLAASVTASAWAQGESREAQRFDLLEFEVEGSSVLPALEIERALLPFLGPGKTVEDVEKARGALEQAHRAAGFPTVVVDIPEQRVDGGVVILSVTEGRVSRTRVVGARYYDQGRILAAAPSLAEGTVPFAPDVQRELADLNRSPNRRVTPVLRPGKLPGTTEVDLQVEDRAAWGGSVELNNRQSPGTEQLRLLGSLRYENLWQRQHAISLQYQTSPQDTSQVRVWSGAYVWPLADGRSLAVYAVDSTSDVPTLVSGTTVLGAGRIYGARLSLPLPAGEGYYHGVTLGVDRKDFDETLLVVDAGGIPTPLKYTPFVASYTRFSEDAQGSTEFGASLNFSIRGLGNDELEFENKRFRAQSNFMALRLEAARTQNLPSGFSGYGKVEGQLANQPLVANEQFIAGGLDSVRGYLVANAAGDNAIRGSLELRTPRLLDASVSTVNEFYALAFADAARLWVKDALPAQVSTFNLAGTGIGLRARAWTRWKVRADVGYALSGVAPVDRGDVRVQFVTAYDF